MEKVLVRKLLNRYSQFGSVGRPVSNTSHSVEVKFGLSLIQIINLDERNQVLTTSIWFKYVWEDILLQWNPSDYDNVTNVRVPSSKIWIPDIVLYNFADTRLRETREALVVVQYNGSTLWMPQAILKSTCQIDITYFPFDEQKCYLKFGSWTYDGSKLDLKFENRPTFDMSVYLLSHEWNITKQYAERNVEYYECCPQPFIDLKYHLKIRRRVAFYSVILILPCALLSLMTLVIFWVPPESPAKLQLGMNIFVAFFVLLLLLADSTPRASVSIPLIGAYYCLNMVMITVSTVLACFGTNMFFRGVRKKRAPKWLRTLMIRCVAKLMFSKELFGDALIEPKCVAKNAEAGKNKKSKSSTTSKLLSSIDLCKTGIGLDPARRRYFSTENNQCQLSSFDADNGDVASEVKKIRVILQNIHETKYKSELYDRYLHEWRIIAVATDRLFFVIYVIVNVATIMLILYTGNSPADQV